jgi:hypothetical protein
MNNRLRTQPDSSCVRFLKWFAAKYNATDADVYSKMHT